MNRRSFCKTLLGLTFLTALPLSYSVFGERKWYDIREVPLAFHRLPQEFDGLKVVQISDIHFGHYFDSAQLKELVHIVNSIQPDVICFTGDLIDEDTNGLSSSTSILSELKANHGKFAVLGNHDYWGNSVEVTEILQLAGFQVLTNRSGQIINKGAKIRVAGVDDASNGNPDIEKALENVQEEEFILLLSHVPDYADISRNYPIDLQLSGHSHGGQVRIPYLGHIVTPHGAKKYVSGLYQVPDSNLMVYVNRGIGTTIFPIRFSCRPEITVFTLKHE